MTDFDSFFVELFAELREEAKHEVDSRVRQFGLLGNFSNVLSERRFATALWDRFRVTVGQVFRRLGVNPERFVNQYLRSIEAHGSELIGRVNNSISDLARTVDSVSALKDLIDGLPDLSEDRALLWADTEMYSVTQQAELLSAASAGEKFKTWVTRNDDRVRPHHVEMEGVRIPIDALFQTADGQASAPGDPRLAVQGRINCRCELSYD